MILEMSVATWGCDKCRPIWPFAGTADTGGVRRRSRSGHPIVVFAFPRFTRKPLSTLFCWCRQFLSSLQRGLVVLSMKLGEYQDLYRKLGTVQDIDFLAENFGYDKELLLVVYTQRIVRDTTKKFYRVKAQARRLAFMWQNGTSLLEIARRFDFPPILTALMVLEQRRISRKNFWKMLNDISGIKDKRLRRELEERDRAGIVHSPQGTARPDAPRRGGGAEPFPLPQGPR